MPLASLILVIIEFNIDNLYGKHQFVCVVAGGDLLDYQDRFCAIWLRPKCRNRYLKVAGK